MNGYLYIIKSQKNNRYYIGSTNDIERRMHEHSSGQSKSTKNTRPWELVYLKKFDNIQQARREEYRLKKQKSRVIIEKLIINS